MKAVYEKEIKSYFLTLQGYVFIGVFLLISGYFFVTYNVLESNSDISEMLDNLIVSFILLIPLLTMRLFAEERHMKTDKVYMSAPISAWQIAVGKYLAAFTVYSAAVVLSSVSGWVMVFMSGRSVGEIICTYLGFILIGGSFTAIGMYVSAMTENQIVAAVISFCVCFFLYIADWLLDFGTNPVYTSVVKAISITAWYDNFLIGILDIPAVLYFLTVTALFVFFTVMKLEKRRCG